MNDCVFRLNLAQNDLDWPCFLLPLFLVSVFHPLCPHHVGTLHSLYTLVWLLYDSRGKSQSGTQFEGFIAFPERFHVRIDISFFTHDQTHCAEPALASVVSRKRPPNDRSLSLVTFSPFPPSPQPPFPPPGHAPPGGFPGGMPPPGMMPPAGPPPGMRPPGFPPGPPPPGMMAPPPGVAPGAPPALTEEDKQKMLEEKVRHLSTFVPLSLPHIPHTNKSLTRSIIIILHALSFSST